MNLVEFALKFRDQASSPLRQFGAQADRTFTGVERKQRDVIRGNKDVGSSFSSMGKLVGAGVALGVFAAAVSSIKSYASEAAKMYCIQLEAETKLATVMRQRIGATDEQIDSIKKLAQEQQKLGVIGDEVQLSGAQQMATFVSQQASIETLLPSMNNLLAQQKGLNATSESAVNIGNLMGKAMQGQTSALTRVGITFTEAQEKVLKYGNEQERAAMLAQVIQDNVGDMNAALAATDEGKLKQMSNAAGDVQEQFGRVVNRLKVALLPVQEGFVQMLNAIIPIVEQVVEPLSSGVQRVMSFVKELKGDTSDWCGYFDTVKSLIVDHVWPVIAKVGGIIKNIVSQMVTFVKESELLKDVFSFIGTILGGLWDLLGKLVEAVSWIWDNVVKPIIEGIEALYRWIKGSDQKKEGGKTTPAAPAMDKKQEQLLGTIAKNTHEQVATAQEAEQAIVGGGQKVVNITVGKFLDYINIEAKNVTESKQEIQELFEECLYRTLANGATAL